ncbi:MAG TPA: DUF3560 domain-containing protein [Polyangiales bacterium]|nr:DUF3560 domain-containing protein [Polyangiales bacterium]
MTRRERLERKLEKREDWATTRDRKSDAAFAASRKLANSIPLGQPILVGHHSEKRARRDVERIRSGMSAGVEHASMADHHRSKAGGLSAQLEGSIFSDDPDALDALAERVAELEAKRDNMKRLNASYRKCKRDLGAFCEAEGFDAEKRQRLEEARAMWPYSKAWVPFESYQLSNLGANIRRLKSRAVDVANRQRRAEAASEAGGTLIEGGDWVRVTFEEKPARATLDALKAAGFRWSGGSWCGMRESLPAGL